MPRSDMASSRCSCPPWSDPSCHIPCGRAPFLISLWRVFNRGTVVWQVIKSRPISRCDRISIPCGGAVPFLVWCGDQYRRRRHESDVVIDMTKYERHWSVLNTRAGVCKEMNVPLTSLNLLSCTELLVSTPTYFFLFWPVSLPGICRFSTHPQTVSCSSFPYTAFH